jgi:hypothetical protein
MAETEIRERAEAYIDDALAEYDEPLPAEEREAAIERIEVATRKLAAVSREQDREPVAH